MDMNVRVRAMLCVALYWSADEYHVTMSERFTMQLFAHVVALFGKG